MEPSIYRKQWLDLKNSSSLREELHQLSRKIAFSFIDRYYQKGLYVPEYIDLICEMATSYEEPELNKITSSSLFEIVVEQICDDYEYMPVEIYTRVMSQVITFCRNTPAGESLDKKLSDFGIFTFEDIYSRSERVHSRKYSYDITKAPEKIILLSRVTIGADVAILSVMIQKLSKFFPKAEIVIIGNDKLAGIFGGSKNIRLCKLSYARKDGLLERLSSWHSSLEIISDEIPKGSENKVLLIDPDSRISQLGVLPVSKTDNYLFFNSRKCIASSQNACMAELANHWMDSVFGKSEFCFPAIWTPMNFSLQAKKIVTSLRAAGCEKIIAVNFGVGGNPRKSLGLEFEKKLLRELLKTPRTAVLLDSGFGQAELSQSAMLLSDLQNHGFQTFSARFADFDNCTMSHGLAVLECTIGEIASIIAQSDEYIGYDSACQHIAAAAQTPTLTIFAGINNMHFIRRWSACGNTQCKIVHANTLDDPAHIDVDEIILRITEERAALKREIPKQKHKISEIKTSLHKKEEAKKDKVS
ncbi:MAG: hypothetical protein JW787_11640 [Sedimentisphaerales bacterium]|nr:hypothetical protein [Sedimentisphaerales bacterium]